VDGPLAATRVGGDATSRTLLLLHGIYGRGRNWQSIARSVVESRSEYECWLIDLPHHGDSAPGAHGDTVAGLAADVNDWCRVHRLTPAAVLGHSYGGKVALAMADLHRDDPLQVWVIDSTPEVKEPSGSAWAMLALVRRLPSRFATREAATSALVAGGYSLGVAQWMATNLARTSDGFVWKLDFAAMERLLLDFFSTDLWHVVETAAPRHDIHVVKASESSAISDAAITRLEAAGPAVHVHHRAGGHWIHAESPQVIADLLIEHLPH
jgi:pimeloyl-ACP methyl ester carboxylesterase